MLVDAKGLVCGRLSTKIAKSLIQGDTITIVNAQEAVIVGTKNGIMTKFRARVDAAVKSNPLRGPKYDRIPSKMLRKMVKGMLPNKKRTSESFPNYLFLFSLQF